MKKRISSSTILIILACFLMPQVLFSQALTGNGNITRSTRQVSGFEAVSVSSGIDLYITQGSSVSLEIEADENLHDNIVTEVKGDVLRIYNDQSVRRAKELNVYLTIEDITAISASGGSDVESKGMLNLKALELECSGGSDAYLELKVEEFSCYTSGGSDADLTGEVNTFKARTSGGSDLNASDLKAAECYIEASGGSDASVYATDKLEVTASGGSDVTYKGTAVINATASGGSDLHKR